MATENQPDDRLKIRRTNMAPGRRKGAVGRLFFLVVLLIMTLWAMRYLNSPAAHRVFRMFFGNKPQASEEPPGTEEGEELTPVRILKDQ